MENFKKDFDEKLAAMSDEHQRAGTPTEGQCRNGNQIMKSDKTSTTEKIVGVVQPRLVRLTFWYFLRWLRGPVGIAQGLAQTISFGCWEPSWILKMEGWFLDYSWEVRDLISSANN